MANFLDAWRQLPARQGEQGGADGLSKQERTRRRLLGFAIKLFADQGYQPTTAAQIAAAAGVSRATFFAHFPTKAALLGEFSRELADHWVIEPSPASETPVARMLRFLTFLFRETDRGAVGTAILIDYVETYGDDMSAGSGHGTLHHYAEALVADLQSAGLWQAQWPAAILAHHILSTVTFLRAELVDLDPQVAAQRVLDLIACGVAVAG